MVDKNIVLQAKRVPMDHVLDMLGVEKKGKKYRCPFHSDRTPSASITNNNLLWCFACNNGYDTISVVQQERGLTFQDSIDYLLGSPVEVKKSIEVDKEYIRSNASSTALHNFQKTAAEFRPYSQDMKPHLRNLILEHKEDRKLNNLFKILKDNNYSIGLSPYKQEWQITYRLNGFYIKRGAGKEKYVMGNVKITPVKVNSKKEFVIVEGITDALACAELGYNAISLNGKNNYKMLQELWIEYPLLCTYDYIIGTDNDEAGLKCRDDIAFFCTKHNINFKDFKDLRDKPHLKDVGELLKTY